MTTQSISQRLKTAFAMVAVTAVLTAPGGASAQELKVAVQNMAPWLDPGRDFSNVGSQYYVNTFEPLIAKDPASIENRWKPGLATSWTQTSPTTIELKIRSGVTFQNGDPMTVDDVVFSLDRIINATFPPYTIRQRDTLPNMAKVERVDAETVRITAKKPEPLFETLLNVQQTMIVPKRYIMALTGDPNVAEPSDFEAFALAPIGTGPYRMAEFVPGQRLVWTQYDGYWGDKPPFKRVVVTRVPEMSGRLTALKTGEADLITNIPPDQIPTIERDRALKVEGSTTPLFHVIIFNTQHPKMANKKLRQALSLAIDRNLLNDALWGGKARVPSTHTFEQFGALYMPDVKTFEYDPVKAKRLLAESGYDGTPIRYDTQAGYYTNALLAAQAIQEMWAAIGVKMELNLTEKFTGGDSDMMVRIWSNPLYYPDPAGSFGVMWAPGGYSEGQGRFKPDAAYVEAWERFRFSTDLETRKKAYVDLMNWIKDDPPVLPLYQPYEAFGMKRSVNWKPLPGHIPYVLDFRAGNISIAAN